MAINRVSCIRAGAGYGEGKNSGVCRGGLYRPNPGEGDLRLVPAGLPENVQMRSIVVYPRNSNVILSACKMDPTEALMVEIIGNG